MTHPTSSENMLNNEELDALEKRLREPWYQRQGRRVEEEFDAADAITILRDQLAEMKAELARRVDMHECAMAERDDATLYSEEQKARADRAEAEVCSLKAAIFGSENYAHDLKCGNFVEMAQTLHAAQKGGLDRAERAEQRVATLEAALAAQIEADLEKYGPHTNEGLLPNLGLQPGDRVVRVTGHDKWSDPYIGSEYTFCINSNYRKGVPHLIKDGSGWTTMTEKGTFRVIGRKPHDRTALDRMLAEAREISEAEKIAIRNKALREAAEICSSIRQRIANGPMPEGARFDYEQSILALIEAKSKKNVSGTQ